MSDGGFLRTEPLIRPASELMAQAAAPARDYDPPPAPASGGGDQLSRIEDKAARIEDKFARSEALMVRMQATFEDLMGEFGSLARRADMVAIQKRVRFLPGFGSLILAAIVAAVLGSVITLVALKMGVVTIESK